MDLYIFIGFGLLALVISIWAEIKVKSNYNKYLKVSTGNGMTASQFARKLLDDNDLHDIKVERISGELTDNYHHSAKTLSISSKMYDSDSIAGIAVAAHEAGHALQYKAGYFPIKIRNIVIPLTNFASSMLLPLLFIGIILSVVVTTTNVGAWFIYGSIIVMALSVLVNLVTLPVEFDASRRAMKALNESGRFSEEELAGAKSMLTAAALTYVAALAVSIIYLLRFILIVREET